LLEEVRLLTNLETTQQKLLQIVLAGQPELDEMLDSFELRQIKQRIALRCHLEPLNLEETRGYIQRRLQIAGVAPDIMIFSEPATNAIFRHSNGFPRLINTICENALLSGYARRATVIPAEVVGGSRPRSTAGSRRHSGREEEWHFQADKEQRKVSFCAP